MPPVLGNQQDGFVIKYRYITVRIFAQPINCIRREILFTNHLTKLRKCLTDLVCDHDQVANIKKSQMFQPLFKIKP